MEPQLSIDSVPLLLLTLDIGISNLFLLRFGCSYLSVLRILIQSTFIVLFLLLVFSHIFYW